MEEKKYKFDYEAPVALTANGALSYSTTTSTMVDQFGKAGGYRGRTIDEVFADQAALWESNNIQALRFPFYLRMVTRKTKINEKNLTEQVQKGQGVRDESFKRLLWFANYQPDLFYKNLWVLPIVGSWKDVWTLLFYDITLGTHSIDHSIVYDLINQGLRSATHCELIKKYMPRIRAKKKCNTPWSNITNELAKEFARHNKLQFSEYNKFKSTGTAHDFQKLICSGRYADINWDLIPGRALSKITTEKFLKAHDLIDNYTSWIEVQPTAKFTGYVHELMQEFRNKHGYYTKEVPYFKQITINKQFDELVRKATEDGRPLGNVWCALDTSGSMGCVVDGNKTTAFEVCIGLGIFLSTLNQGAFHKNVIMFDDESYVKRLDGTFCEMVNSVVKERTAWGSTNFQSIVDTIVNTRKTHGEIPLEEYPNTILVISDMQFNPVKVNRKTNYDKMKSKLYEVFPKEFVDDMKFIWWQVNGKTKDFPAEVGTGQMFLSGYDGSIISLLLGSEVKEYEKAAGRPITTEESIAIALSQEILQYVSI